MSGVGELPRASVEAATASFKAAAPMYGALGGVLYAALCKRTVDDPELVDIASHGLASATCAHLLAAVHYLLLRDPRDPLARYYATLTENPAPAEEAFPDFARYCKAHREEIGQILKTRTVQATLADRCQSVMPPLSHVAKLAGEPLN